MISSLPHSREAFVWTWLPGATEPVVAGRLVPDGGEWFLPPPIRLLLFQILIDWKFRSRVCNIHHDFPNPPKSRP